jgi:hypothetical protein
MLGRRSLNLEVLPLDPDLERAFRRKCRAPVERESVEMGDNVNVEQPRRENEHREWKMWIILDHLGICSHPLRQIMLRV